MCVYIYICVCVMFIDYILKVKMCSYYHQYIHVYTVYIYTPYLYIFRHIQLSMHIYYRRYNMYECTSPMNPSDPLILASQMAAGSPCGVFSMTCCSKRSSCTKAAPIRSYGVQREAPGATKSRSWNTYLKQRRFLIHMP